LIGWIVERAFFWRKLKLVADFHGSLTKEMLSHSYLRAGILRKIFEIIERRIDRLGDAAVASSWDNAQEISSIRKEQVLTLLDGTRLGMFDGLPEVSELRKIYNIPLDKVVIVYTGALIPNKGIKLLLDAVPIVCEKYKEAHFVIAGFPADQIAEYTKQEVFMTRATIISPLPYFDLPKILKMSDIGIDPKQSGVRQASGKMLQYMGAGLSVVCFETPNNREYLGDGGTYASEETTEGLAEAIGELIISPELRAKLGTINCERAKMFSWEKSARELEEIYYSILSEK
jgi:glycosyltransferase involved in cell wall biosynthesis